MSDLVARFRDSERGVSDLERGLAHVARAGGGGPSAEAMASARLFNIEEPNADDFRFHKQAKTLVLGAGLLGMHNAARHLDHYLSGGEMGSVGRDASGALAAEPVGLTVDVSAMLREIGGFLDQVQRSVEELRAAIETALANGPTPRRRRGRRNVAGASTLTSNDWFYALGRFSYQVNAEIAPLRGQGQGSPREVAVRYVLHVTDFYDWDQDAVTLPIPHPETGEAITIPDGAMRRLHRVGLAREYPIEGEHLLLVDSVRLPGAKGG